MRALITGSAGYIGSALCKMLYKDNNFILSCDIRDPNHNYYTFHDNNATNNIFYFNALAEKVIEYNIDTIFHLGASADVTDSMTRPSIYYYNNIGTTSMLIDCLTGRDWKGRFIFASTAAVYKESDTPVKEHWAKTPPNPYGHSKLVCEEYLRRVNLVHDIPIAMFRFFNVAGAYEEIGDHHDSPHVLQKLCYSAAETQPFFIFGNNLKTKDGTCVRDYVHVLDVCRALEHADKFLQFNKECYAFNLGTKDGVTVKELVDTFSKETNIDIITKDAKGRPGDPPYLVADPTLYQEQTKFVYLYSDIKNIVTTAWNYYRRDYGI